MPILLQAVQQAKSAAEGWNDNIVASRAAAIETAKAASEHAQVRLKLPLHEVLPHLEKSGIQSKAQSVDSNLESCEVRFSCKPTSVLHL